MRQRGGQGEALAAWAAWIVLLSAVVITYSRLPVRDLYRVTHEGVPAGIGRGVVLANYPIALAAIALILIAVDALPRAAWWAAAPALALCAATVVTVDPHNFDFRVVNVVPALGVVIAAALTWAAVQRRGASFVSRRPGDRARIGVAAIVLVLSLPWMAADLGTYLPGRLFFTSTIVTEGVRPTIARPGGVPGRDDPGDRSSIGSVETLPAVHEGHHHGMDGALLFLTAVLLSRARPEGRRLRNALTACLGLMASYGLVNGSEDFWHEQVAKRGWVHARLPAAQLPSVSWIWLVILMLAVAFSVLFACERRLDARTTG